MLLCARCLGRFVSAAAAPPAAPRRQLSRDTSEAVPTSFSSDLEENKTSVTILNEDKSLLMFDRFGRYGFKLNTGIFVLGPVLAFPKSVYSWRVSSTADIGPQSLAALRVVYPRPDVFLLGKGDPGALGLDTDALVKYFRELRIGWEILPTEEALTTFNFLNAEGRYVAGAFLPPSMRDMYREELAALLSVKRRRGQFSLADTTGGTYGGPVALPSISEPIPSAGVPQNRRRASVSRDEAEAARLQEARVQFEAQARRLEEARRRVSSEEEAAEDNRKAEGDGDAGKSKTQ